nr:immunoglobulin light chain junction region [Macaca mulatta]
RQQSSYWPHLTF